VLDGLTLWLAHGPRVRAVLQRRTRDGRRRAALRVACFLVLSLAFPGVLDRSAEDRRAERQRPERYVVVLRALTSVDEVKQVALLLGGLSPEFACHHTCYWAVPRSKAVEAYRRILNSPYRNLGSLIPWDQEPFLSEP
jgi:hypothetical protein